MRKRFLTIVAGLLGGAFPLAACAAPLTPGNILVSSTPTSASNVVREFTPAGAMVQTFSVPTAPGGDSHIRGLAGDAAGKIQIYNGTFSPFLTTLDPVAGTFSHHTLAGWDTIDGLTFGGLTVLGNAAYATDMVASAPNGLVRLDLGTFSATRIASGTPNGHGDYICVSAGLNGLLYATWPGGSPQGNHIDVIEPGSGLVIKTLNITPQINGITADENGNIFGVGGSGSVSGFFQFDPNTGAVVKTLPNGLGAYSSLAISAGHQLVAANATGNIVLANTSLTTQTSFFVGAQNTTFVNFVTPVPEPAGACAAALVLCAVALRRPLRSAVSAPRN